MKVYIEHIYIQLNKVFLWLLFIPFKHPNCFLFFLTVLLFVLFLQIQYLEDCTEGKDTMKVKVW